jgi:hypothetical protein
MRRTFPLAGVLALALAAAGCGTKMLNTSNVEKLIKTKMSGPPFNASVKGVKCPDQPVKKGDVFTCTLTLTNGQTADFRVTQIDNNTNVNIKQAQLIPPYVQNTVQSNLATQNVKVTATCPEHVAVVVGATFTCSLVSASGQHGTATMTILDDSGGFRITGIKAG